MARRDLQRQMVYKNFMKNLPNIITLSRLASLPVLLILMFVPQAWAAWTALILYTLGCITDYLDGYLARKMKIESAFGKFIDPIADKIFVITVILCLVATGKLAGIWVIPPLLIITREFLISGLREFLGPKNISVPVSKLAKWKTGLQMTSLGFLIVGIYGDPVLAFTFISTLTWGHILIMLAALLTVHTGWDYLKVGIKYLRD